jgi:uncharacterized protein (DUF1015 family)
MVTIKPFKALRPKPQQAAIIASRPYDVINRAEASEEVKQNNQSFLRITRAEVDLPFVDDVHDARVYEQAHTNLQWFLEQNLLSVDAEEAYYFYELTMNGRSQTGLVCLSSVADYNNGLIKKHEFTRPEKEKDRIDHMLAINAQTGNVFMAMNDVRELNNLMEEYKNDCLPLYSFIAADGIEHKLWQVVDSENIDRITHIFRTKVPAIYIADGHHRAATAAKVAAQLPTNSKAQYFLNTIFPAGQLYIMDYNRVVKDLNNHTLEQLIEKIKINFEVSLSDAPLKPNHPHQFGMYCQGQWYNLQVKPGTFINDAIGVLDVTILQNNILEPLLNIDDPRTNKRVDFVGGIRGLQALEKRVDSGDMAIAFSCYPVSMQQLFAIADQGKVMPPKSTWFEPKLRDGLLTHIF